MIPLQVFLQSTASIYRKPGWIPEFHIPSAWEIAQWSLRQVGLGGSSKLADGDYVFRANVEVCKPKSLFSFAVDKDEQAESRDILKKLSTTINSSTPTSQVYSLECFKHAFTLSPSHPQGLSDTDVNVILIHLSRDLRACAVFPPSSINDMTIIKFSLPGSSSPPAKLTEQDTALAQLLTLRLTLTGQIKTLDARLAALEVKIRSSVSGSSKSPVEKESTLGLLRMRKNLASVLSSRQGSLHQVETVLQSIDDAATQVDLVRAMQNSSSVLHDLNRQVGGVEGVDKVMDGLREEMEAVEDVNKVMAEGNPDIDEGEIEDELEALLEQEQPKKAEPVTQSTEEMPEDAKLRPVERNTTQELKDALPNVPRTGFGPVERRKRREEGEAEEMEKRLSVMSLEDQTAQDNESRKELEA